MAAVTLYKLTDAQGQTHGDGTVNIQWGAGITHTAAGPADGALCSASWIHGYEHPLVAVLMNPIHANLKNPQLWKCNGEIGKRDGQLKCGCRALTTVELLPLPEITTEQKARFAIGCAWPRASESWKKWATAWLSGKDRTAGRRAAGRRGRRRGRRRGGGGGGAAAAGRRRRRAAAWAAEAAAEARRRRRRAAAWAAEAAAGGLQSHCYRGVGNRGPAYRGAVSGGGKTVKLKGLAWAGAASLARPWKKCGQARWRRRNDAEPEGARRRCGRRAATGAWSWRAVQPGGGLRAAGGAGD